MLERPSKKKKRYIGDETNRLNGEKIYEKNLKEKTIWYVDIRIGAWITRCSTGVKEPNVVKKDLKSMKRRKRVISTTFVDINIYSEEQGPKYFLFRTTEIGKNADPIGGSSRRTSKNNFYCTKITAACIVKRLLAAPFRV